MRDESQPAGRPDARSAQRAAMSQRERAADERQREADERQREADKRQRNADERERQANERERQADQREALADKRERRADERERQADERERKTSERERAFLERVHRAGLADDFERRELEDIERERASLTRGGERVNRREAGVRRARQHRGREQAEIDRESAASRRAMSGWPPDLGEAIDRLRDSRDLARKAILAFASHEDQVALVYEELAASLPGRRAEYRRAAEQARETAREARDLVRAFTE